MRFILAGEGPSDLGAKDGVGGFIKGALTHIVDAFIADFRADVVVEPCRLGKSGQDIELGQSLCRLLDALQMRNDLFAQLGKGFVLDALDPLFCAQDFSFPFLQFRRDEALAVGDCLFADVAIKSCLLN